MEYWREELYHHGILGQRWGKRNGPPYPLSASRHSANEKKAGWRKSLKKTKDETKKNKNSFHLTDKQKKYIKIGLIATGTILTAYGGYKLAKSGVLGGVLPGRAGLPGDLGGVANPNGYRNNCKEVTEATLKRWLGVDPSAVAGPKSVDGNLHDFIESRGYNPKGVQWISETGGITPDRNGKTLERVTKRMLKKYGNGDCGAISLQFDEKHIMPDTKEKGHAFNWFISNNNVLFVDDQLNPPASINEILSAFHKIDLNKEIEIVKITKDAFL